MNRPKKFPLDKALNLVVIIAFGINIYYLFATDNPPKWVRIANVFGWLIFIYVLLKRRFKQK
ncbi:hypothetical protein ACFOW1_16530 [Parasediminibacterium paludis]|uniref:Uncharacterized protein n=1 Tax=Parasediminibacterium paludis TaxID=908966 RepID=A0ABV8Q121_9BACT